MDFNTPQDKKKYTGMIDEIVDSMYRSQAETELVTEICKQAKDQFGIAPADTKKIAKIHFEQNIEEVRKKALGPIESYEELYDV